MEINNMPLIINQGKQDLSKDSNKFEIITEKNFHGAFQIPDPRSRYSRRENASQDRKSVV
jgi:hypothetical protein